jgi:hypothetical protein
MSARYFLFASSAILLGLLSLGGRAQAEWQSYRSERFGYQFLYPADLLKLVMEAPDGQSLEFQSDDGQTKLKVLTTFNTDNVSPAEYRAEIIRTLPGYGGIDYGPRGSSWFVLSGVRGSSIYYQKVLFACGGRIINAFALTYPSAEKREYDSIVTTIEKGFRSTSGPACDAAGR